MPPPVQLGPWMLGPVLGAGDSSSVHRCTHVDDPERRRAIKVLGRPSRETMARFRREGEILADLDHPGIVKMHGIDLEDVVPYLEMDLVEGPTLRDRLLEGPIPIVQALELAAQLCDALGYLHSRNVHHRDITLDNLVVHEGGLVLVDFGLAKTPYAEQLTLAGARFGGVSSAPPEWIGSSQVDGAAWDLYAMGTVIYALLTGQEGFPLDPSVPQHMGAAKVMAAKRELPHLDIGPGFSDALRELVRSLTAREPQDRPRTATEVLERLLAVETPDGEPTRPEARPERLSEEFHQASNVGVAVSALMALGVSVVVLAVLARFVLAGLGWYG